RLIEPNAVTSGGQRQLKGTSCQDVSRAAAVAVAMAIYDQTRDTTPTRRESEAAPDSSPPPSAPQEGTARESGELGTPAPSSGERHWHFPLEAGITVDGSLLAMPSVGAQFGLGVG